jgi:peptidoglycan/LPS O-acetylase OafA/YrhL
MNESPQAVSGRHLPALDGVRAFAILGVIAYHLGFGWASGGYLGVDLFFVLSGFLITSLLLEEWCTSGRIRLGAFWGRRARRLLPALFFVLIVIALYAVVNGRFSSPASGGAAIDLNGLRGDALATLLYVANWHAIFSHQSYFTQFSTPSPLQHTWSLAIEEQFYLVWPIVTVALLKWSPRRWRTVGLGVCVVGALASATAMAVLYHPGSDPSRIYYGTDTRAFDILAGATVAMLAAGRPQPGLRARSMLHIVAPVAAAILAVFWITAGTKNGLPRTEMFRGEFLACAVLAAVVIADARLFEQGPLGRLLSVRPLCWIGSISYGLYLWHWPIFVYLNQARTGLSGAELDLARVGLTFAVATLSYYLVERPIRRRRYTGLARGILVPSAALLTVLVIVVGTTPSVAAPARAWAGGGLYPGGGPDVPGAGGFSGEVPIALPKGLMINRSHPLRVLAFGDSVMSFAQYGITAALDSTGEVKAVRAARTGWGLTMPGAQALLKRRVQHSHPQLVIGTWSWDSAAAKADPSAYQRTLDAAIRQLLNPGDGVIGVIFLQMPPFGPIPEFIATSSEGESWKLRAAGLARWNEAVQQSSLTFPGRVMYLPVASSLEFDGRYTSWLPPGGRSSTPLKHWVRVRTSDGVHLCPPGISRYSASVLADLTELFHLSPTKGQWWNSHAITVEALTHQDSSLAVTCPDDHPPT